MGVAGSSSSLTANHTGSSVRRSRLATQFCFGLRIRVPSRAGSVRRSILGRFANGPAGLAIYFSNASTLLLLGRLTSRLAYLSCTASHKLEPASRCLAVWRGSHRFVLKSRHAHPKRRSRTHHYIESSSPGPLTTFLTS